MMPDSLQRIELGRISRQIVNLQVCPVLFEPRPDVFVFVVRRIVLNEINLAREIASQNSFQISDVRVGAEDFLKMIKKPGTVKLDGPEDFQGVSLPRGRDLRLRGDSGPRLIKGGVLSEAGFVLEEEGRSFAFGFFLRLGYS